MTPPEAPSQTRYLSLAITFHLDPPVSGDVAYKCGQEVAEAIQGEGAMSSTDDDNPGLIAWRIPVQAAPWTTHEDLLAALHRATLDHMEGPSRTRHVRLEELSAVTVEELARQARNRRPDLVGIDEFREILAPDGSDILSRQRFYQLQQRPDFPRPLHRGIWIRQIATDYARGRNRTVGRPPGTPARSPQPVIGADGQEHCPVCSAAVERDEPIDVTTRADAEAGRRPTQPGLWRCPNGCDPRERLADEPHVAVEHGPGGNVARCTVCGAAAGTDSGHAPPAIEHDPGCGAV